MPEGPEIRRAADRLARAVEGDIARAVSFGLPPLRRFGARLSGRRILRIRPRGKALLTTFEGGLTIYSHNQLYGRWVVARAGDRPRTTRELRLAIETATDAILLYSASDIAVLDAKGIATHPFLAKLGPDLLDDSTTPELVRAQLEDRRFAGRTLAALLLDQAFVAGIGNYLRSEMLHVAGVRAARRPKDLDDAERTALAGAIISVGRQAWKRAGVTNDWQRAQRLKAEGLSFEARRFHVFGRDGLPCWTCGEIVERTETGGRRLYTCPGCQG
jgi:endonuclease-8